MMEYVLLGAQLFLLAGVVVSLIRQRQQASAVAGLQRSLDDATGRIAETVSDIMRQVTASRPTSGIWRILRRGEDGKWRPSEWVREGSVAWQEAHDTPGLALRHGIEGEVVEGVQ